MIQTQPQHGLGWPSHKRDEFGEALELLADDLSRRLILYDPLRLVHLGIRERDHDFRPVEDHRVQEDQRLAKMVLSARTAENARRSRLDRHRLAAEWLIG